MMVMFHAKNGAEHYMPVTAIVRMVKHKQAGLFMVYVVFSPDPISIAEDIFDTVLKNWSVFLINGAVIVGVDPGQSGGDFKPGKGKAN